MYVLCKKPPSAKKTPIIYEIDRRGICPVCGASVTIGVFDLAMKRIVFTPGHVVSNDPYDLLPRKRLILSDRAFYRALQTSKGATT